MIFLLNTTKTMDLNVSVPRLKVTEPRLLAQARLLASKISNMSRSQLIALMPLSDKLANQTRSNAVLWGGAGRSKKPAIFSFTGLFYKSLDIGSLEEIHLNDAQKRVHILFGLYGLLRPFDLIEAYRLEMGQKLAIGKNKNLVDFWKEILTAQVNKNLKDDEPVINLAAQEYIKALDIRKLKGPVISPVFKEKLVNGTFKTVAVHSKKARGALVRYALLNNVQTPRELHGFNAMGWKATAEPPEAGPWLFTRQVTSQLFINN
ncbi:YaaA family protein [Desulfobacula sp.]|uniref:YaaA family protein n=1 Tax=Desulfobacula sp. TaxID=2593537 RepID=UPI00261C8DB1|nr:YaaA family protein [Desulfobacula sp.]